MKKRIFCILIVIIMLVNILGVNVYASTPDSNDRIEQNIVHFTNGVLDGYSRMLRYAGIIIDTGIESSRNTIQFVKDRLIALGLLSSGASDEDVEQFFDDNIEQSGKDITYTSDLNVYIKSEISNIISGCGSYYAYSFNISTFVSQFGDSDIFNAVKDFIEDHPNDIVIVREYNHSGCSIILVNNSAYSFVQADTSSSPRIRCQLYNNTNWNQTVFTNYSYNSNSHQFVQSGTWPGSATFAYYYLSNIDSSTPLGTNNASVMSYNGNRIYKIYKTLNDLKSESVGQSPYYISDSYNTYKNTSDSYNTNSDNHSVTYSDVVNFNNTYYGDNGNYPTAETIYQYINTNEGTDVPSDNTPSDNPSGGGGSGGSDSGDTGIFDFLSRLGEVLASLIKNLGSMLTSLIESLITIVNDLVGKIPNLLSGLLGIVFSGLPEELRAIIVLGVTCMVIFGIIKLIKG